MLTVRQLAKTFPTPQGPLTVLGGVDLDVGEGESVALMGESGSGKSTLLHLVAGLEPADGGEITLAGQRVDRMGDAGRAALRRGTVGLVFQQFNLVPSLTVAQNLALQARLAGRDDPDRRARLADRLGLGAVLDRYPERLSGGQQQRVAIGRALAARPALVLADEPTGNLDQRTGDAVIDLALELIEETGCTFLMATHSARLAGRCARTVRIEAGRLA